MSNCSCNGENSNCYYCDGTGTKRENYERVLIVKNSYERNIHSDQRDLKMVELMNVNDVHTHQ